jgi:tetratricopeptide (TPR) repeat protein
VEKMTALKKEPQNMKLVSNLILKLLPVLLLATTTLNAEEPDKVAELIEQAHKHDNMYTLGPEASQQKAIALYRLALSAEPDKKQRLHILYRMAQLNGSSYQKEKGEKPNFQEAIRLYKEIANSYPPDEPLVFKSMISIGDHYVSLWDFTSAIDWFKQALEYNISEMEQSLENLQKDEQKKEEVASLKQRINRIRRYQEIAVDQTAYATTRIHPQLHDPVLKSIVDKYPGSFIAEKAQQLIDQNPHKISELDIPLNFGGEIALSDSPTVHANAPAPVTRSQHNKGIKIPSDTTTEIKSESPSVEPNITERLQNQKRSSGETRAPPLSHLLPYIIAVAGLIVLGLAVIITRKKPIF